MKRNKKPLDREQLLEQMRALACARVNDAVKLAYLPEEEREAIGKLDLSALIEFRRSGAGTVELKFADPDEGPGAAAGAERPQRRGAAGFPFPAHGG